MQLDSQAKLSEKYSPNSKLMTQKCKEWNECAKNAKNGTNAGKSRFIMPPWAISLVFLGVECKFESIAIPVEVPNCQVHPQPFPKYVSAATAKSLLSQIARLTSIAQTRSLQARDVLVSMQHEHERAIKAKDEEITRLKLQMKQFEQQLRFVAVEKKMKSVTQTHAKQLDTVEGMYSMDSNIAMASNVNNEVRGSPTGFTFDNEEVSDSDDSLYEERVLAVNPYSRCVNDEKNFNIALASKVNEEVRGSPTGFTSDGVEQTWSKCDTNEKQFAMNVQLSAEDGADRARKRKYRALSEGPENIIYGMPNQTRSCML